MTGPRSGAPTAPAAPPASAPAEPLHTISPAEAMAEAKLAQAPADLGPHRSGWSARLSALGWLTPYAAISAGAVLGANARYAVGLWAAGRWGPAFPWGTLIINVTGSLLLGFYLTLVTERFSGRAATRLLVATGFCGAYTTFSTFSYEAVTLLQRGLVLAAAGYVVTSLAVGLLAAGAGVLLARAL